MLIKQFGLKHAIFRTIMSRIKPIFRSQLALLLIIESRNHNEPTAEEVRIAYLDKLILHNLFSQDKIDKELFLKFEDFLNTNCTGLLAFLDDSLTGYAFIQHKGLYKFIPNGSFLIPEKMTLLKNLMVFPEYRGLSIGKILNQKRIASVPNDKFPLVFVKADNRYAIRNLKMFGFEEKVKVRIITWFGKWSFQKIKLLVKPDHITDEIIKGLTVNNKISKNKS